MPRFATILRLTRLHPFAAAFFAIGALAATLFVLRTIFFIVWWSDPDHRHQALEPWMTPRYISHSWEVPPDQLEAELHIPDPPPRHPTLAEIARLRGISVNQLMAELTVFLAAQSRP